LNALLASPKDSDEGKQKQDSPCQENNQKMDSISNSAQQQQQQKQQ
jgi:hypothetical protein